MGIVPVTAITTEISVVTGGVGAVEVQGDERNSGVPFSLAGAALGVGLEAVAVVPSAPALVSDVPVATVTERVTDGGVGALSAEIEATTAGAAHVLSVEAAVVVGATASPVGVPVAAITGSVSKEVAICVGIGVGAVVGDAASALAAHGVGEEGFGVV